ncbi:MAG: hypothetical protein HY716_07830 [Planctomycetes bacterium]|nr:hypothetical protein [Planctomycetota bacterium]
MKLAVLCASALLAIGALQVQEKKRDMKDRVWAEGKIVCIGCFLAEDAGAEAQCTLHAKHAQGFLDKEGKLWTIVDNERGHFAITNAALRNQPIRIFGWPYEKHRYLELYKYQIKDGDKWQIWDFCKT